MISGISSYPEFTPRRADVGPRPAAAAQPAPLSPEVSDDAAPADIAPESDDAQTLFREFTLFDLASRQFGEILPRLEMATSPVE